MIRVAFASDDVRTVNLHFGAAEQFVLYDIRPGIGELVGVGRFVKARMKGANAERGPDELPPPPDAEDRMTEDKVKAKIDFLRVRSCAGVYAAKVGVSSIRRLLEAGIQPVMVNKGFSIEELLNEVSLAMACGGISWVERAMSHPAPIAIDLDGDLLDSDRTAHHELITSMDDFA